MKKEVQQALSVLVGKPLWSCGNSAALEWFEFGERRTVTRFRGGTKEVGEYALHVQCAWRITQHDEVVIASGDVHDASEQGGGDSAPIVTRANERVQQLFQRETRQLAVEQVKAGDAGAFSIMLADGYVLEVMPDDSSDSEHWRLFKPYVEGPHFVVTGAGLQT